MGTFDFAPLYRVTVGFDRVFSMLDQLGGVEGSVPSYPPYNIERASENAYRISVAVAGFADADLSIETKENRLTIPARCSSRASPCESSSVASSSPTMSRSRARAWRTGYYTSTSCARFPRP
jgi:HSP20 family molecular chaperone IbpA